MSNYPDRIHEIYDILSLKKLVVKRNARSGNLTMDLFPIESFDAVIGDHHDPRWRRGFKMLPDEMPAPGPDMDQIRSVAETD